MRTEPTLVPGMFIAAVLEEGTAPRRCYVGEIAAVDARGARLSLLSWLTGNCGFAEVYIPLRNVASMLISPPDDEDEFLHSARQWQNHFDPPGK